MSFSVELWDGYDLVFNTFTLHRRGLKDFIYMLSEKHDAEVEFARSMKKIYDLNFAVTKMPSLQNGIFAFKSDLFNQYNYTMEFINSLREEVIDPLKVFMNEQNNQGKIFNLEMKKVEKEYKDSVEKLEKSRIRFHTLAKNAEDAKLMSEMAKLNQTFTNEAKSKFEAKSQNTLKEAKDAERVYIANINTANNSRDSYIENMKRMLNEFQKLEEKLIEMIKDSLRKYVIYQVALIRNMQYDIEKKAGVMEGINIQSDVRSFIEKNATNALPPYKFEFIPYISEIDSRTNIESQKYPKDVLANVKNFISNVFYAEPPESEPDSIETKNNNEIEVIVNIAWQGKKLPEEEKKIFFKFIKEKKYRRFFLNCLNKFRLSGLFTLDDKSYYIIGELLYNTLDEIVKDRDFHSAKNCVMLAQTLYKTATEPNKPRIFLQALLEEHPVWKNMDFWEEFIKYVINEEMHSQKNYNIYTFESQEEKSRRFKSIVVTQLISFSYNMLSFEVNKDRVKDLILYLGKYYDIEDVQMEEILKNLEDYSYINENKVKESLNKGGDIGDNIKLNTGVNSKTNSNSNNSLNNSYDKDKGPRSSTSVSINLVSPINPVDHDLESTDKQKEIDASSVNDSEPDSTKNTEGKEK